MGLYVEDQLGQHIRELVEFVKKAEQAQKRNAVPDGAPIPGERPSAPGEGSEVDSEAALATARSTLAAAGVTGEGGPVVAPWLLCCVGWILF
jgi:hypothetical protein